ncbi:MAG TPA: ABC transporter substrate-binding protein [Thermoanaerobaculia bacterium]|nr:ABC transporter substrate-binding protein [Thermoanaerobaculia bacterium]
MIGARLLNRYEVVSELGRGGMGVVYRARDPMLNRDVAVKLIPPALLSSEAEERFQREAQVVAQMNHPSIVPIYDIGRHEGSLFFLMPVVTGRNLRRFLSEKARSVGDVVEIGVHVAEALEYSHARGVVHRDIKPENVMVAEEEGALRVYVMDFGLAKATSENRLTKTGTLVGTVAYFSPEQVIARDIDHRSDIYSLGVVLYECLAGEPPFTGEVQSLLYRIVHEFPRSLRFAGVNISQELDEIILMCLAKDPLRRYQRASELGAALKKCRSRLADSEKSVVLSAVMTAHMQRPSLSEMIDREKEFGELQRRLNAVIGGECQFAVVGGEPGVGKTRLVEELENLARARKIRVVHGRFVEQNRAFAYQAFADLIQDYFRSRESGTSSGTTPDFSDLAPELVDVFPALNEIAAMRGSGASSERDAQRRRDDRTYLYELLARTLLRMSSGRPLIVVLENLHAAEASLEALQYVIQRLTAAPVFIVGTYRQTEIQKGHPLVKMLDAFADDPRFASILLGPLTSSHHEAFVASVIGGREISRGLLQRIFKATEGNPFFTRELVRSLIESGGIVRDDSGTWTLSGEMAISSDALPATIQQAVEKRIERLPEDVREVLALASVLGKSFDYEDLEAVVEDEKGLDKTVDRLVTDGLLEEERESRGDRLAFTSAIVRDVLYGSLSRRRRRSLHRRYAEHLEQRHAKRLEGVYPDLVHHYSEGDVPEKTVEYGLRQARRALESFSTDEAVQVIRTVLEFTSDEEWTGSRTAEAEARLLLAMACRQQAALDPALREAEAARKIFERENERSRAVDVAAFAADAAWQGRRVDDARRWIEEGIHLSRETGRNDVLATFLSLGATVSNLRGDYNEAKIYFDEAERLSGRDSRQIVSMENVPAGGTLRCPIANLVAVSEPALLNTDEDAEILALVFENLVNVDEGGVLSPALAHAWEIVDGGRAVKIAIDRSARFSDGSPVTAADVKRSFERAASARPNLPAVLDPVVGVDEFRKEAAAGIAGIEVMSDEDLVIRLSQPLAFYPAMLSDPTVAIAKTEGDAVVGSGPFRVAERTRSRTVLVRNENDWRKNRSRLDRLEFEVVGDAQAIASAFRQGDIDIARDLSQRDLDELLRDPRIRPVYVESPRKNTYFILFNQNGPLGSDPAIRRALGGVLRIHELVWRSLGRLAQPAPSLVPPSIFGHDPGRRRDVLTREEASYLLEERRAALGREALRLNMSIHPVFSDRFAPLARAIADVWKELGVEVHAVRSGTEEYLGSFMENDDVDFLLGRWNADYDDADNFTYGLFHSENGVFRRFFSTPATDALLEQARAEPAAGRRETLYRSFENTLVSSSVVVPLFHEINYRVARRHVRGLKLRSTRPYVNYAELGVAPEREEQHASVSLRASELHVAILEDVRVIDPAMSYSLNEGEVVGNVFETLTRCGEGARIIPWLASEFHTEEGGQRYRFRLRDDVRFHDGRRLTARDVRFSWERRLASTIVSPHLAVIRGAKEFMRGEAKSVAGIHVVGTHEVVVDLEQPLAILPAVLSQVAAAIVPEGSGSLSGTWRDGCAGTGPFRVVDFQPGKTLELERNPDYWRPGLPKIDRLIFSFRTRSESVRDDFVNGRLSIVWDLSPGEIEELLHDRSLGAHHKSSPRLGCYMLALNRHSPVMGDREARRRVIAAVDVDGLVRRTLGRVATPATGMIPPGLLGYTGIRSGEMPARSSGSGPALKLRTAVHPIFLGQFRAFTDGLAAILGQAGIEFEIANQTMQEFADLIRSAGADAVLGRWMADFPDADNFTHDVVHSAGSWVGTCVGTPELDDLTERARREADLNARNALYRHIEDVIAREGLILPLFYQQAYHFLRPEIDGLAMSYTAPEVAYEQLVVRR